MGIESILSKAYTAIKAKPAIALPEVIVWLPSTLLGTVVALAYSHFAKAYSFDKIMAAIEASPSAFFSSAMAALSPYVTALALLFLVLIAAAYYVKAAYPFIAKDINDAKPVSITDALKNAKSRLLALFATDLLLILLIFAGFAIGMAILFIPILGILIDIAGFIAFIIYIAPLTLVLTSVVVLEGKSGIAAIKEAYAIIKNKKLYSWLVILVLAIIAGIYMFVVSLFEGIFSFAIGSYATIITMALSIFATSFVAICETLYYFELKPTEPPKKESKKEETNLESTPLASSELEEAASRSAINASNKGAGKKAKSSKAKKKK